VAGRTLEFQLSSTSELASRTVTRRTLISSALGGVLAVCVGTLTTACMGAIKTPTPSTPAGSGTVALPTHVPLPVSKPDLPPTDAGVAPGYRTFPKLLKSVSEAPGTGGDVNVLTYTANAVPPPVEQNPAWQEINRRLNVNLRVPTIAQVDYPTRLATAMAGNDLPDLVLVSPQGSVIQDQDKFLESSCADLTPYLSGDSIKDYPNLANLPTYGWRSSIFNGRIYGVPSIAFYEGIAMYTQQRALDQAGVGQIQTAADFLDASRRMLIPGRQWAINGNTSPLGSVLYYFLGVFRAPNTWRESGGKLTRDWESDEYRAAVAYVRSLWDAGVIHPDTPTMTGNQAVTSWNNGQSVFFGQLMANFAQSYDKAIQSDPAFKPRILPRFSVDGKDRGEQLLTSGLGGLMALKKASPERIKELLGVLNFLAAPFGTEEALLLRYGVEGADFQFDDKGNPIPTQQGLADLQIPLKFVAYYPPVIYDAQNPDATQLLHDAEVESMPLGVQSPVLGLYSPTDAAQSAHLNQAMLDGLNAIMFGRASIDTFDQLVADWRQNGGDKIRSEYEQALQRSAS
jgi:putative aldouronate transport system substrate-binding protein